MLLAGVVNRGGREVDAGAGVPERGEAAGVEAGSAAEIEDGGGLRLENFPVNPRDLPVDDGEAAAGEIVRLAEMLRQHPAAEIGVVPRDFLPLGWRWCCG